MAVLENKWHDTVSPSVFLCSSEFTPPAVLLQLPARAVALTCRNLLPNRGEITESATDPAPALPPSLHVNKYMCVTKNGETTNWGEGSPCIIKKTQQLIQLKVKLCILLPEYIWHLQEGPAEQRQIPEEIIQKNLVITVGRHLKEVLPWPKIGTKITFALLCTYGHDRC